MFKVLAAADREGEVMRDLSWIIVTAVAAIAFGFAGHHGGELVKLDELKRIDNELTQIEEYLFGGPGGRDEEWATSLDGLRGRLSACRLRIIERPSTSPPTSPTPRSPCRE